MPKRILCGYGCDIDAVAHYLHTRTGKKPDLADVSRGIFGAEVGCARLLKLFEKKNIKASWYIPGHTIESFPKEMAAIRDAGHEIGLHSEQFEAVLVKSIEVLTEFTGKKPAGFTAPCWDNHPDQIPLLEKYGIEYDHSFMHRDFQCYWAPSKEDEYIPSDLSQHPDTWMKPMVKAPPSDKVVVVPASWVFDDWPAFQFNWRVPNSQGFVDTRSWENTVKDSFTYCYENYETFVFPITVHPQVSGRPHLLKMHERIIDFINEHEGVEWMPFEQMAKEFRAGFGQDVKE
ncbi:glucose 1-dehydrogenase [Leucosporidium creatinivorum]|uniref:Glucose 1-dehydrogenase n=1 Tax=Leucosporidium creatinivorum TaxID=106004 RepID=A0A1Y2FSX2_9BASI|nr:glucose 1-dehydrogenase [Leucosporidium creatinivorum]